MKQNALLLLLVCLAACAEPLVQSYSQPRTQARLQEDAIIASDGVRLPLKQWKPRGTPKAIVIALHGMNDYSNAFAMPGEFFSNYGIHTYAYDQRGFGNTEQRGIWAGEDNLASDLRDMVQLAKTQHPKLPVYILGESMGAAVAIISLSRPNYIEVDGVILSAPAVWGGDGMNPFYRGTLWMVAHMLPEKIFTGEGLKILASDNYPMLRELSRDPLVIKGTRADSVLGLVRLMGNAYERLREVNTPMLLLYGKNDQVIPQSSVEGAKSYLGKSSVTAAYYPNGYHMLLRDLNRDIPLRDVAEWILGNHKSLYSGLYWVEQAPSNSPQAPYRHIIN